MRPSQTELLFHQTTKHSTLQTMTWVHSGNLIYSFRVILVDPLQKKVELAYTLLPDGNVQFKGILIDLMNNVPDGIKVDLEGNIYVAVKGNIVVYSPKGKQLEEIEVPNKSAKNLCFGRGEFSKTLFITTSKKLYTLEVKKEGFHIPFKK